MQGAQSVMVGGTLTAQTSLNEKNSFLPIQRRNGLR